MKRNSNRGVSRCSSPDNAICVQCPPAAREPPSSANHTRRFSSVKCVCVIHWWAELIAHFYQTTKSKRVSNHDIQGMVKKTKETLMTIRAYSVRFFSRFVIYVCSHFFSLVCRSRCFCLMYLFSLPTQRLSSLYHTMCVSQWLCFMNAIIRRERETEIERKVNYANGRHNQPLSIWCPSLVATLCVMCRRAERVPLTCFTFAHSPPPSSALPIISFSLSLLLLSTNCLPLSLSIVYAS